MENLDPQYLEVKQSEIKKKFNDLQGETKQIEIQEAALAQQKQNINLEMLRLQGENRLIDELLGKNKPATPPAENVTPE